MISNRIPRLKCFCDRVINTSEITICIVHSECFLEHVLLDRHSDIRSQITDCESYFVVVHRYRYYLNVVKIANSYTRCAVFFFSMQTVMGKLGRCIMEDFI